jgi:hypothetical protein
MADKIVRDILIADPTVSGLVGQKISPLIMSQGISPPAITTKRVDLSPQNALSGHAGLDENEIDVESWATTYVEARQIADAVRAAIQRAGILMIGEFDNYEQLVDPGLYSVTQKYSVWK